MDIPVQTIREKLIPLLCSLRIGYRTCKNSRCNKAIDDLQEWIDNLLVIEQGQKWLHHCDIKTDWTR